MEHQVFELRRKVDLYYKSFLKRREAESELASDEILNFN